ncbi:site-specific integrase [Oceanidesulfovibrio marinus]|nr:site-specific integrase [Oceanidesulfovibrio marinus]
MQELTNARIRELVDEWIRDALEAEYECLLDGGPWTPEKLENHKYVHCSLGAEAYEHWERKDFRQIRGRVDAFLAYKGLEVDKDSMTYKKLCDALLKAEVNVMREVSDEDWEGPSVGDGTQPAATAPHPTPQQAAEPPQKEEERTLGGAMEKHLQVKMPTWDSKTRIDAPSKVREFVEIVGADTPLSRLDRDAMRRYLDVVQRLPSRRTTKKAYRDKTIPEIMAMDVPVEERLSNVTIRNRFIWVRSMLNWFEAEDYIPKAKNLNKVLDVKLDQQGRTTGKRVAFTEDDLSKLFDPEAYGEDTGKTPSKFWLPILALYTGARLEELAQLHLTDIHTVDDVLVIDINDEDGKRLKTAAAVRRVPVHPFLRKLGFTKYASDLTKQGEERLFPDLPLVENTGKYSAAVSQWFTRYRREQGVDVDADGNSKVFHSFRHTFITRCKHLGLNRQMLKEIVGHEQGETDDVTAGYEGAYPPAMLLEEIIKKIDFHERVEELNHLNFQGIKM